MNFPPTISLGNWLCPSRRRQLFCAAWASLKTMASAVLLERHPLDRTVRCRTVANVLSMGFGGAQMLPMLGGKVVERQHRLAVLDQACGRLVVLDGAGLDEGVEGAVCVVPGLGHPDLLESTLCLRVLALGQLVEHVGGLVHPTALAAGPGPHFLDRLPEAERAVGDGEFGRDRGCCQLNEGRSQLNV